MKILCREGLLAVAGTLCAMLMFTGCGPDYPECYDDENCQEEGRNEYCVNAKCQQCRDDSHCAGKMDRSYVCESGSCVKIAGFCDPPDFPCPEGMVCRDNFCGPECNDEYPCPAPKICENNRCVDPPDCVTDDDCPAGQVCRDGFCVTPPKCQFRQIYFDFDESAIRADARATLEENAGCYEEREEKDGAGPEILITGHCDERGTEEYNMALGERRARSTKKALRRLGVPRGKMDTRSRGEYDLVVPNARTEAQHQKNRRCEFDLN